MTLTQLLRILWARKWIVLALAVVVTAVGAVVTLMSPKQYQAAATLVVDVRADPVLGAVAPGLASPAYMSTQIEIIRSDRVASRVVKMLGVERSPSAVRQWRDSTNAKIPLERYFANLLLGGLGVEPSRGSNVISISFTSPDAAFAAAAANAFAQAYMDVSVELRVEPTRQNAAWLDEQNKTLRANLETAQAKLSAYQREHGIVVSDERLDQESSRLGALTSQLTTLQSEQVDAAARQRNTGTELSPDVQGSPAVQSLKSQLASSQTKLSEISSIVGKNHPQRVQLEAQIAEIKQQLASEIKRVSGGSSVASRSTGQKVGELRSMVEAQKQLLLSLRSQRDQIAVLVRDVDTAQRAYEMASNRVTQLSLEGQNTQATTRSLSPAIEPYTPTKPRVVVNIMMALAGGLLIGAVAAVLFELIDRRVRSAEDLRHAVNVPVIGVLRPADSRRPVFRQLTSGRPAVPALTAPRMR